MESDNNIPEKVAWVFVRAGQVLVTRNHGRDLFYFPGGHREPGETDAQTLLREIDEELQTTIAPDSMVHFGTYETRQGEPERPDFRMICYTADHRGPLTPSREIAEKAWFSDAQPDRVSPRGPTRLRRTPCGRRARLIGELPPCQLRARSARGRRRRQGRCGPG